MRNLGHSNLKNEFIIEFLASREDILVEIGLFWGPKFISYRHLSIYITDLKEQWIVETEIYKLESIL